MPPSIVVTGDCLRPSADGSLDGSNVQTRWLHRLIERQLQLATGLRPRLLILDPDNGIDAHEFYRKQGIADRLNGWAGLYDGVRLRRELADLYGPHLRDAVVVGFELPPYLRSVLEDLRVPYVDFWVHPIRFLDDLVFGIRSSDPTADETIRRHAISEEEVWMTAGLRRATAATGPRSYLEPDTTLYLAQAKMDKSQVRDGRFVDCGAFDDELRRLLASPGPWLVKPHPYDPDHPLTTRIRDLCPHARTVNDNVYQLLAQDEIARVVSLNSSSAIEARYFGKAVTMLIPPVIEVGYRGGGGSPYWTIDHRFLDPDFWRQVLAPVVPTTPPDGFRHAPKPNRFRTALHSFWGFQQIDTDIFVNIARPPGGDTTRIPAPAAGGHSMNLLPILNVLFPAECDRNGGRVRLRGRPEPRIELFGPYLTMQPGRYRLNVRYRLLAESASSPFGLDICNTRGEAFIIPRRDVEAVPGASGELRWEIEFEIAEPIADVETRLWSGREDVVIEGITLDALNPELP